MRPLSLAACALVLVTACSESPSEPTRGMPQFSIGCNPSGPSVVCSATAANLGGVLFDDVTRRSSWLFSGAAGSFTEPGTFVPTSSGEVDLWARFEWAESYKQSFLVSPTAPARRLKTLGGHVLNAATNEKIVGATVRIVDGYAAGRSTTTNAYGAYAIDRVIEGETITVEAEKEGYVTVRVTYDGAQPPFLQLRLQPR